MNAFPVYYWPKVVGKARSKPEAWAVMFVSPESEGGNIVIHVTEGELPSDLNSIRLDQDSMKFYVTFKGEGGKIGTRMSQNCKPVLIFVRTASPDMSIQIGTDNGPGAFTFGTVWDNRLIQAAKELRISSAWTNFLLESPWKHIPIPRRLSEESWKDAMSRIREFVFSFKKWETLHLLIKDEPDSGVSLQIFDEVPDTSPGTGLEPTGVLVRCWGDFLEWISYDERDRVEFSEITQARIEQFIRGFRMEVIDILQKFGVTGPSEFTSPAQYDGFLPQEVLAGTALGPFAEDQMSLLEAMGYAGPLGVEDPRAWLEAWANENQGST